VATVATTPVDRAPTEPEECIVPRSSGCTRVGRVRVGSIALSSPTCTVDLVVKEGDTGTMMKCSDGAYVEFGDKRFGGTFDGIIVDACTRTEFPFSDGCTWETRQRIVGRADTTMRFSYREHAVAGIGCSPAACTASADIVVVP
jgi:hypothetical protein